jgi:hypothetical protein
VWRIPDPTEFHTYAGRDVIKERLAGRRRQVDIVVMTVAAVVAVEASSDRIIGRTTIEEKGRISAQQGLDVLGVYDDDLVRVGGHWLYARRVLSVLPRSDVASTYRRGTGRF